MIAPTMSDHLTALRACLLSDQRAPRTIHTYAKIAGAFLNTLAGSTPTTVAVEAFLARPRRDGARRAATSRNQELAALRSLAKVAVRQRSWETNPTEGIRFTRKVPRDPPFLGADELRQLFRAAAERPPAGEGPQILAILGLLSQTGLRVHELVGLDLPQADLLTATLLSVRGKGGTVHDLPLNAPAVALVTNWLPERASRAPPEEKALFISSRGTRLSARTVENWFVRLRAVMGTAKKLTPHTLRHSAATLALTMGTDLATVAELLRHRDLNTTRGYLHLVDTRRREAVHRLAVTVPQDVLEAVEAAARASVPVPPPANETVPQVSESPATPHRENLDDQYRLVAAA
jgi:integrase/recombinase XerC